jgi:hypothetical protein
MGRNPRALKLRIADCGLRILGLSVIVAAGCASPQAKPLAICPGRKNAPEALQVLQARARQAVAFRATGQCYIAYHVPDEKGAKNQSLALQNVFFQPPSDMYIQGNVTAVPRALIVGSNETEFWLAMRPKEIDSYYWGRWDDAANAEGMLINPAIVLEAFGILGHEDPNAKWSFEKQGPYDVLTRLNATGQPARRFYIYSCDYLVRKMEHFGLDGHVVATAGLEQYKPVVGDFQIPTRIHVVTVDRTGQEDTIDIRLSAPVETTFSKEAQERAFKRNPKDMGQFKHIYRLVNGYWMSVSSD